MRRTPGKAKEYAKTVPGGDCVGYESLQEFLSHPNLDAVYIATRPGTHLEICQQVAKAKKVCFVEKPVGRCAEETQEILNAFDLQNIPLFTAYVSRGYEKTNTVKTLIKDGVIGERLLSVSYTNIGSGGARDLDGNDLPWRLDVKQSGGGLIMDVGCHIIDRLEYICGAPLCNIEGIAKNRNSPGLMVEDFVSFEAEIGKESLNNNDSIGRITKGASINCSWDFGSEKDPYDELIFRGSKGYLKMKGSLSDPVYVYDMNNVLIKTYEFDALEHQAQPLIQAITNNLLGKIEWKDYLSRGDNALRTQKILDTILSTYYGGREIGYWDRIETQQHDKAADKI